MENDSNVLRHLEKSKGNLMHLDIPKSNCPFFLNVGYLADELTKHPNVCNIMHDHNFYVICFFTHAKGMHIINFEEFQIHENMAFFLCPTHVHKLANLECCNGFAVSFSKDFIDMLSANTRELTTDVFFNSRSKATTCRVKLGGEHIIYDDFYRIYKAFNERKMMLGYNEYLASLLSQLLLDFRCYGDVATQTSTHSNSSDYKTYLMFADCIENNFKTMHKVANYARAINMSVSSLNKSILKVTGKQPSILINERILTEAKLLLSSNMAMRIKDIVFELGFYDESNFTKFFKRNAGMSPMRFRECYGASASHNNE